ncbi:hypothetical protein [Massilia oculi]|uniref:hypothetical protein n=1 Tax=Massilia oculi TaxID=945844 RepID=UPI0028ADCB39|nr:hypothetical protein [Massilia oculi]
MGQSIDIPKFVAAANERNGLVPKSQEADLAANIEHAYRYVKQPKTFSYFAERQRELPARKRENNGR